MQFLDLTRKFFLMQARAHAKVPRIFVINRLSFLCLRSVDARSLSIQSISKSQEVFLVLVILRTSTR